MKTLPLLIIIFLAGCASAPQYQRYNGTVLLFDKDNPIEVNGESHGQVSVGSGWYGSSSKLYPELAEEARNHGANVVVNIESYYAPGGGAWAAPHLQGLALKVADPQALRKSGVPHREF